MASACAMLSAAWRWTSSPGDSTRWSTHPSSVTLIEYLSGRMAGTYPREVVAGPSDRTPELVVGRCRMDVSVAPRRAKLALVAFAVAIAIGHHLGTILKPLGEIGAT